MILVDILSYNLTNVLMFTTPLMVYDLNDKRLYTRIRLVKTNDALVKEIEESYDVDGSDIDSDLAEANINI